jgi:methylglyoxal reductase
MAMNYRNLGASGISASVIGLGTWAIGGWMWGGVDQRDAERAIDSAIDLGVNLIDTAPVYGFGASEELVGRAIRAKRDRVVLATKCGLIWNERRGQFFFSADQLGVNAEGDRQIYRCLAPDSIQREVDQSLRRLHTDHIDLYQTHWQEETTPIADTMAALAKLKQSGKIRAIGVSNAIASQMAQYRQAGTLDSDQEKFSMLDRQIESDQLPFCREQNISVLAYSPLALGLLTGQARPDRQYAPGDQRMVHPRFKPEAIQKVNAMLGDLRPLANAAAANLSQLVLAWTLAQPGLTHVLVGARNQAQALENAKAGAITLSPETLNAIAAVLQRHNLNL